MNQLVNQYVDIHIYMHIPIYTYNYIYTHTFAYIYTYIYCTYVCICILLFLSNRVCFDNANGIQVVDLGESFRMRQSKVMFVLQVSSYDRFCFGKGSYYIGNLQGEAGGTSETEPWEPRWAVVWSLHINKNSKIPSKHSLARE